MLYLYEGPLLVTLRYNAHYPRCQDFSFASIEVLQMSGVCNTIIRYTHALTSLLWFVSCILRIDNS
jgi:hypothetical protein